MKKPVKPKKNPADLTKRNNDAREKELTALKSWIQQVESILATVIAWQEDWSLAVRKQLLDELARKVNHD